MLLLIGMCVALLAITALLMRIGHANDLRTKARQAADAAALAAVTTVRDHAISMIRNENIAPAFLLIDGTSGRTSADQYAQENKSLVTEFESGGLAAKVTVRTRECLNKEEGGGKYSLESLCVRADSDKVQDRKGQRSATATSAAEIKMPLCLNQPYPPPSNQWYVECDGQDTRILSDAQLAALFKPHLTASYNPNPPLLLGLGGGGTVPNLPPATDAQAASNENLGRQLARDLKHWEGQEWQCLDQLWLHESGWDHHAKNSSSGAYGIPQSLPGNKMASAGSDWPDNPETQIKWGLNYIAERYGTPCNAWAQWQARSPHWY